MKKKSIMLGIFCLIFVYCNLYGMEKEVEQISVGKQKLSERLVESLFWFTNPENKYPIELYMWSGAESKEKIFEKFFTWYPPEVPEMYIYDQKENRDFFLKLLCKIRLLFCKCSKKE